ncbi:P-loop containing nucleoside triphosphate hydrolase protein [Colletotrichum navitas]|uniref:P-loop containing nucleoside triphosphate hydrolase protein n=1 Tax=Colletotrichum navitas TaxID=681940 RepID=A0AAD8PTX6_9PEZI|nr:P-loop containing nucleoside triphosphate hydrolase protein [Colletotrichum navitas]KAK1580696.1 P-loop containing nucleoside triphosphate hydrolase protein [Colletotrichum navitas]
MSKRGEEFISYTKWSYSYYRGRSLTHEPEGTALCHPQQNTIDSSMVLSEAIESPVVVDFERCLRAAPAWRPGRIPRGFSRVLDERAGDLRQPPRPPGPPGPPEPPRSPSPPPSIDDDRIWDVRLAEKVLGFTDPRQPIELHGQDPPSGDDVLLLPNRVFAFILRTRKWDDGHRAIIKSLMATHFRKKKLERRQFDIIQDKGPSSLSRLPETVAQFYNKPLLPITCGDLGMTPAEVENNLQSSFQKAQAWDCVLLLDEADVFLAERSQDNIERNALVSGKLITSSGFAEDSVEISCDHRMLMQSVFLRVMEYYEGVLFLTTNKVGSFDEAFKSRMSMALYYPPLTREQTRRIWEMQMNRTEALSRQASPGDESQHVRFNHDEVATLADELWNMQTTRDDCRPVWNGREIRNAFQTAVALAEWHKGENRVPGPIVVGREHFEKVARVSNEFNAYLYEVRHGRADYEKAHAREHRFDDFNRQQFVFGGHQGTGFGQQQGYGMGPQLGSITMPFGGGQAGITPMGGGGVPYGNNTQSQGAFFTNQGWQPGYGGGVSNTGIGGLNMAGPSMGASGGGNNMGTGMSPGSVNVQVLPSHSIQGQLSNQQQQQQGGSSMGPGGPMLPGFR